MLEYNNLRSIYLALQVQKCSTLSIGLADGIILTTNDQYAKLHNK